MKIALFGATGADLREGPAAGNDSSLSDPND